MNISVRSRRSKHIKHIRHAPKHVSEYDAGKARLVTVIVYLVVIVALIFIFIPQKKAEAPVTTNSEATSTAGSVSVVNLIKKSSETDTYTLAVETPVVSGFANPAIEKSVNDQLAAKIDSIVSDFESQAVQNPPVGGPDTKSSLTIQVESSELAKDAVFNVRFEVATYFSGAAHPITVSETSNFDINTGKDVQLVDLFDPSVRDPNKADSTTKDGSGAGYLNKISAYSTVALKQHLAQEMNVPESQLDGVFFAEGANSNPENFSTFLVENDGIRFIFGQYQVAPYAAGEQEVLIPYSELSPYFLKGEPMDSLAK